MQRLTAVSLFCGAGGLDLGFQQAGFRIVYAADSDPAAVACHARNVSADCRVRDVTTAEFRSDLRRVGTVDVVLGGFPCQGFSKAGPKRADDDRNTLYRAMRDAVGLLHPRLFIAENVDGLKQNFAGSYLALIQSEFEAAGYSVEHRILDAAAFGVPQHRRRIFFVGTRAGGTDRFRWPRPTHAAVARNGEFRITGFESASSGPPERLRRPRTIRDAIHNLVGLDTRIPDHRVTGDWPQKYSAVFKAIGPGQKLCNVRHSPASVYTWEIPEVFGRTTIQERVVLETIAKHRRHREYGEIPNGNPLSSDVISALSGLPLSTTRTCVRALLRTGYLKVLDDKVDLKGAMFCSGLFKRPCWDAPAPTVLTNYHSPRYFLHPSEDRPFSLRECARLQSFPDSFVFADESVGVSLMDGYRLVGNAVPPLLARALATEARRAMHEGAGVLRA